MMSYLTVLTKDLLGKRRFQLQKDMDDLKYDIAQEQTANKKKAKEVEPISNAREAAKVVRSKSALVAMDNVAEAPESPSPAPASTCSLRQNGGWWCAFQHWNKLRHSYPKFEESKGLDLKAYLLDRHCWTLCRLWVWVGLQGVCKRVVKVWRNDKKGKKGNVEQMEERKEWF